MNVPSPPGSRWWRGFAARGRKPPAQADPRRLAARRAGLFFLVSGVLALVGLSLPNDQSVNTPAAAGLALVDLGVGALLYRLPWQRWHRIWTLLLVVPAALAVMAGFYLIGALPAPVFGAFMILVLFWVGLSQPPGTALCVSPAFALAYFLPQGGGSQTLHAALVVLPVAVLIAESTAATLRQLAASHAREARRFRLYRALARAQRSLCALDWNEACAEVTAAARQLGFDAASLQIIDHPRRSFHIRYLDGLPQQLAGKEFPLEQGVTGLVVERGDVVAVEAYARHPHAIPALRDLGIQVVFGAPVRIDGHIAAVLVAFSRTRMDLDEDQLQVFRMLADQAAVALANATRHGRLRDEANQLSEVTLRDELTGLGNRRQGQALLASLQPGDGLVMIDLDHFKQLNDGKGHAVGDAVLREFGHFVARNLRQGDQAVRWGGEEFLLVLPAVGARLQAVCERMREAWNARAPATTFSAGACLHGAGRPAEQTLRAADAALYAAKGLGRDRVCIAPAAQT
ncbi:MAG: diguanylate cyclase [Pseudomonadota bacterium]